MAFAAELLVEEPTPGGNSTNRSPFMAQPPRQDVPPPSPPPPPPPPPMEVSEDEGGGGRSDDEGGHKEREMRTRDAPSYGPVIHEVPITPRSSPFGARSSGSADTLTTHLHPSSPHEAELLFETTYHLDSVSRSPPAVESHISRSPVNGVGTANSRRIPQTRAGSPPAGTAIRPGIRSPVKTRRDTSGSPSVSPEKNTSNYSLMQMQDMSSSPSTPQQQRGTGRKSRQPRGMQPHGSSRQSPRVQFSVEGGREPVSAQGQKGMTSSLGFTKKISREMQRHLRQKVQLAIEMWRQRMNKKPTPAPRFGEYHQAGEEGTATARATPRQSPKRPRFSSLGRSGNMASDTSNMSVDRPVSAEGPARGRMMEPTLNRSRLGSNSRSPSVSATRKSSVARHDCNSKTCTHPSHAQENRREVATGGKGMAVTGKRRERTGRRRTKDAARSSSSGEGETAMSSSRSALASPPSSASKRGQNLGNASSRSKSKIPRLVDEKPKKGTPTPRSAEQQRGRNNYEEMVHQSLPLSRDIDGQYNRGHSDTVLSPMGGVAEHLEECIDMQTTHQAWLSCHDQISPRESGVGDDDELEFEEEDERLLEEDEGDAGVDIGYRGDEEGADEEEELDIARELQAVAEAKLAKRQSQKPNSRGMPVTSTTTSPPNTAVTTVAFVQQQQQQLGSAGDSHLSSNKGHKVSTHGRSSLLMDGKGSRAPPPGRTPPAEPVPSPELDVSQLVASGKAKILLPADAVYPPGAPKPLLLQTMVDMELSGVSEDTRNDIIRKRQRQEVYALNRIMTSLEFAQFENFCRTHNIPLSI